MFKKRTVEVSTWDADELARLRKAEHERGVAENARAAEDRAKQWEERDWKREGKSDVFTLRLDGGTLVRVGDKIGFVGHVSNYHVSSGVYGYAVPYAPSIEWIVR